MFVRKKKNKGGTFSVLLVTSEWQPNKKHSNLRLIKNFGCATNEEDLNALMQKANDYRNHLILDAPKAKVLKIISNKDLKSCYSVNVGFKDIYGNLFNTVFKRFNLGLLDLQKLNDIVTMRIASPASKRKTAMLANEYGLNCQVDSIYKLMDRLTEGKIMQAKQLLYQHTINLLSAQQEVVDVIFYDLTTIYFETNEQTDLRDFGFSKDGKHQHVQIMLAVMVTKHGLPIDYQEFPGNCYEGHTLLPVINKIKSRYKIEQIVLVADAALMSKINLQQLTAQNIKYVIAARIKNTKKAIKQEILALNSYQKVATIINNDGEIEDLIKSKTIDLPEGGSLVAYYSTKRAMKDAYDRERDLEKIKQYLGSTNKKQLTSKLKKAYVTVSKGAVVTLDLVKLNNAKQYDGFFGLQTNLEQIEPKALLSAYRGLWQVEQTFRIIKSDLGIRPVFHYNTDRIKAHFLICYISLALMRYVQFILAQHNIHYSCEQLNFFINQMRVMKIHHSDNTTYELLEDPPSELIEIYKILNISWRKKFSY